MRIKTGVTFGVIKNLANLGCEIKISTWPGCAILPIFHRLGEDSCNDGLVLIFIDENFLQFFVRFFAPTKILLCTFGKIVIIWGEKQAGRGWRVGTRATLHFFVEFMICVRSLCQTLLFSEV